MLQALGQSPRLLVVLAMLGSTALTWAPFLHQRDVIYSYWDGPHYVYLAKTLYNVPADHPFTAYGLKPSYYATHLPAYPLLIRALVPLTWGRYLPAMLLATVLSSVAAALLFYEVLLRFGLVASPVWTAVLFAFLPPRWVIYHSVGATEPLFLALVFASFLAYRANRTTPLILLIVVASLTRIFGVLLVPVFMAAAWQDRRHRQVALLPLALLGMVALFTWHQHLYGDWMAYFTRNVGQVGHLSTTPLLQFRNYATDGNRHGAEMFWVLYAVYGLGTFMIARHRPLFFYSLAFFALNVFITHDDLSRMFLTVAPFALLVGYDQVLSQPMLRWALPFLAALDCIYAWGLIPHNCAVPYVYEAFLRALK
jgi:hypothetical protein